MRKENAYTGGHLHGLLNIVGNHKDTLERSRLFSPKSYHFISKILGGKYIQGAKSLIETENLWLGNQSASDAHALAHSPGNLPWICLVVVIQTDKIDRLFDSSFFFGADERFCH